MTAPNILIIEARFYTNIADMLVEGSIAALNENNASFSRVAVPGAFEIPGVVRQVLSAEQEDPSRRRFDGYVTLGCVIRGETSHYDYVCGESARGLQDLAVRDGVAIGYGILTVEDYEQAVVRADPEQKNKGRDAVEACLAMIKIRKDLAAGAL